MDAFLTALSALAFPGTHMMFEMYSFLQPGSRVTRSGDSVEEIPALMRAAPFDGGSHVSIDINAMLRSGNEGTGLDLFTSGDAFVRDFRNPPLEARLWYDDIYRPRLDVVLPPGGRSLAAEAAIASILVQADLEDFLLRLCTPDESKRVITGALSNGSWYAPVELTGTYHAFAHELARDIALSWIHLYDGAIVEDAAGLSLEALAARVDAAPRGSRVGVAPDARRRNHHLALDVKAMKRRDPHAPPRPDLARLEPRAILPADEELTREQVLAVLQADPATLFEALEAAAVPDDEWRGVEPLAMDLLEAQKAGVPTVEVQANTGDHVRFIEEHAPYHVRRLPNGGALLATHPFRTLWQLWADALHLLGIRT